MSTDNPLDYLTCLRNLENIVSAEAEEILEYVCPEVPALNWIQSVCSLFVYSAL